jgi:YD repeat-containing protein
MRQTRQIFARSLLLLALLSSGLSQAGSATYTYDALGRVTKIVYSNGVVITYTYDAAGNRTRVVTTGAR